MKIKLPKHYLVWKNSPAGAIGIKRCPERSLQGLLRAEFWSDTWIHTKMYVEGSMTLEEIENDFMHRVEQADW